MVIITTSLTVKVGWVKQSVFTTITKVLPCDRIIDFEFKLNLARVRGELEVESVANSKTGYLWSVNR